MSDPQPRDLFDSSLREWIHSSIDQGPVLLVGPVGAGAEDLADAELDHAHDGVLLRPTVGSTAAGLVASAASQIIARIDPAGLDAFDGDTPRARRAGLELARRYGTDAPEALDIARGQLPDGWTLSDAVGARAAREATPPMVVAITNAHRLAEAALWDLRDLANKRVIRAVATTHREHLDRLLGPRAPLHGNATVVELPRDSLRGTGRNGSPSRFTPPIWNGCSRGHADVLPARSRSSHFANRSARSARPGRARSPPDGPRPRASSTSPRACTSTDRTCSSPSPTGTQPYGAIPDAPSQRVARALAKLRDMDLIEQPVPRTWQIADPILHDALLARTRVLTTQQELATGAAVTGFRPDATPPARLRPVRRRG